MAKKSKDKSPKADKVFKSDRSWGGKNILTGEAVAETSTSSDNNWRNSSFETHWNEKEQRQEGVCKRDGKEIARFIIKPDPKKR